MHEIQGCIILKLMSKSGGWLEEESQLCYSHFAVFTEHPVVKCCSVSLVLYWIKEKLTQEMQLWRQPYITKLCGCGRATCLLWALTVPLGSGSWPGGWPELLCDLCHYILCLVPPGVPGILREEESRDLLFLCLPFLPGNLLNCPQAYNFPSIWSGIGRLFLCFILSGVLKCILQRDLVCAFLFSPTGKLLFERLLGEILSNDQSARAFMLVGHWRIGIWL